MCPCKSLDWWFPNLQGGLQAAIEDAVAAIERTVVEPSENSITNYSISSVVEYTESWPNYAGWSSYAFAAEEQWAPHQAKSDSDGVPSLQGAEECMDLDQDLVHIAVKTRLR